MSDIVNAEPVVDLAPVIERKPDLHAIRAFAKERGEWIASLSADELIALRVFRRTAGLAFPDSDTAIGDLFDAGSWADPDNDRRVYRVPRAIQVMPRDMLVSLEIPKDRR